MFKLSDEVGLLSEERFLKALSVKTERTPVWFIKIRRASRFMDLRGVDFYAFLYFPNENRRVKVPIQIKSSMTGRIKFYQSHIQLGSVVVIIVKPDRTDDDIRHQLYKILESVRDVDRRYDVFFDLLSAQKIRQKKVRRLLEELDIEDSS
jgi:hypothetical protein